jgi:hypothetical protein
MTNNIKNMEEMERRKTNVSYRNGKSVKVTDERMTSLIDKRNNRMSEDSDY